MHAATSSCCSEALVNEEGYWMCVACGVIACTAIDTRIISFNQNVGQLRVNYSRKSRFLRKILGALCNKQHHVVDEKLLEHLRVSEYKTPETFLACMASHKCKKRRPYIHCTKYWELLGNAIPRLKDWKRSFQFVNIMYCDCA